MRKDLLLSLTLIFVCTLANSQSFTRIFSGDIITTGGTTLSVAWGDYDNDGDLDVFMANASGGNNLLFRNNGNKTFTRITTGIVVTDQGNSIHGTWGDYDNDGLIDLFVVNNGEANFLYKNNGGGSFTKITSGDLFASNALHQSAAWADIDSDGDLDLFVAIDGGQNILYRNDFGIFTDFTSDDMTADIGASYCAVWADIENDGDQDLFVANYNENNFLYKNNGNGIFTKVTTDTVATDLEASWSASWADYDNDSDMDLFVANKDLSTNSLYNNDGAGNFTKVLAGDITSDIASSEGSAWGDYDNDGDLDLFVGNTGGENNNLYRNNGDNTFTNMVGINVTSDGGTSLGSAWADYDNDGDLDLLIAQPDANNLFYENNGNSNNYIKIQPRGIKVNNYGVGARVEITVAGIKQTQQVSALTGSRGQNSNEVEFGLGANTTVDNIDIIWPGGSVSNLTGVAANQTIEVKGLGPDLEITSESISPETIKRGQRVSVNARVVNNQNFNSPIGHVSLVLSTDAVLDGSDMVLGKVNFSPLLPFGSRFFQMQPTIPQSVTPGSYFVLVVADYDQVIEETDETNNYVSLPLNIVDQDLADLEINDTFVQFDRSYNPGETLELSNNVSNNGSIGVSNVEIEFYLSEDDIVDGSDTQLFSDFYNFNAGESQFIQENVTIAPGTPGGQYTILMIADRNDNISELDENNNLGEFINKILIETVPPEPSNLTTTNISLSQIDLSWTDNSNVSGFEEDEFVILRNGTELDRTGANVTTYSDLTVTTNTQYDYQVYAVRNETGSIIDFGGNVSTVVANSVPGGINTSANIIQIDKSADGGAGGFIDLPFFFEFNEYTTFTMQVNAPVIGTFRIKIEDSTDPGTFVEIDQTNTVINDWEELSFNFSFQASNVYDRVTIFVDFGNTIPNTFYIDNLNIGKQTIDVETGVIEIEGHSKNTDVTIGYIPDPSCNFNIPTNTTWTGIPQNNPFGCIDPAGNANVIFTDNGDGTYDISDLMSGAYAFCGFGEQPAVIKNPCDELFVDELSGASTSFRADGVITWNEGTQTLTIPYFDINNNVSHVTIFTPNGTGIVPGTPSNFIAEGISATSINLEWEKTGAVTVDEYVIERTTTSGTGFSPIVSIFNENTTKYLDTDVTPSTIYFYRMKAVNADGESPYTTDISAIAAVANFEKIVSGELVESKSGQGSAWGDYDNDGDLDLFTPTFSDLPNFFFENNGDGTFTQALKSTFDVDTVITRSGSWADVNNDGFLDLFLANSDTIGFLYMNNGDKTFTKSELGDPGFRHFSSTWADYDNDGFIDLFIARFGLDNLLYRNNGDGTFTEQTGSVLAQDQAADSWGAAWSDYDLDGDVDLFVANRFGQNDLFYINNGDGTFTQVTSGPHVQSFEDSRSPSWADYDNDGDFDLFVGTPSTSPNLLYKNNGDGTFTQVNNNLISQDTDFNFGIRTFGSSWGDFNNDGWQDLFIASVLSNQVYINNGDDTFSEITNEALVDNTDFTIGGSFADLNNDGFVDLVVPNTGEVSNDLYLNNGNSGFNYINISLVGTTSNRSAIGTKVRVTANAIVQLQEVSGQTGYGSQNSLNLEFGLGGVSSIDEIYIQWPSGVEQTFTGVAANQFMTIVEDGDGPEIVYEDLFTEFPNATGLNMFRATITDVSTITNIGIHYRGTDANASDPWNTITPGPGANADQFESEVMLDLFGTSPGIDWFFFADDEYGNSTSADIQTINLETTPPAIEFVVQPTTFMLGSNTAVVTHITDVSELTTVSGYYQPLTNPSAGYTEVSASENSSPGSGVREFQVPLQNSYFDELGIKMYWTAVDELGNSASTDTIYIYLEFTDVDATLTGLRSGTNVESYQIFSVPLDLNSSSISTVFDELGTYDKTEWRVFHYQNGANVEFQSGINTIDRGKGYWLIAKTVSSSIQAGAGDNSLTDDEPYKIQLTTGWNQIGNPYAFNIAWQDVLDHNGLSTEIGDLFLFEGGTYSTSDRLRSYEGGFINSDASRTIEIPFVKNNSVQGGKIGNNGRMSRTSDENFDDDWVLPVFVSVGEIQYDIAGVGMIPGASNGRDVYDKLMAPRFINYMEVNINAEKQSPTLTRSIVEPSDGYKWQVEVATNIERDDKVRLSWDNSLISGLLNNVVLFDVTNNETIDMKTVSSYEYSYVENRQFEILFGDADFIHNNLIPQHNGIGDPYPNPFSNKVNIPYMLVESIKDYEVSLVIYNLSGKQVNRLENKGLKAGIHKFEWDGTDYDYHKVNPGIYIIRLIVNGDNRIEFQSKIILK